MLTIYGTQGWWPVKSAREGVNSSGYHPEDYNFPRNITERYEIILGAVLTQNTAWRNVSMVLQEMISRNLLVPRKILKMDPHDLAEVIHSAGYHNQKARKIQGLTSYLLEGGHLTGMNRGPSREDLLQCWGIGPETADSILLYGYGQPSFVIDLYTRRILERMGYTPKGKLHRNPVKLYDQWRTFCTEQLPEDLIIYQEFHGLILAHSKAACGAKPLCGKCGLKDSCRRGRILP